MYAIVESGSKQYKVSKGDVLEVEKLPVKKDKQVILDKVLFVSDEKDVSIGKPYLKGYSVLCEELKEKKGKKTISFRYRRRHASSKKKIGHRQTYTVLKVKEINVA
ncbi:MAG: 50S ribosomal protein L21 [Candidatus Omnitrophota bacterium]